MNRGHNFKIKTLYPLLNKFHIKAINDELYLAAFTHPSVNVNNNDYPDYQRLEYLGDAILSACIATLSYMLRDDLHEGEYTRLRSSLVDTKNLSKIAKKHEFYDFVEVGQSFKCDIKESDKIMEDVFEAFVGAVYLDHGFEEAFKLISSIFKDKIINFTYENSLDYKSRLQEYLQAGSHTSIIYKVLSQTGKPNEPYFTVGVYFNDVHYSSGSGTSKKKAEQDAARNALKIMAKDTK